MPIITGSRFVLMTQPSNGMHQTADMLHVMLRDRCGAAGDAKRSAALFNERWCRMRVAFH